MAHPEKETFEPLQHIAIIMDGNGRWAKKRGLPRTAGHSAGGEAFRKIANYCRTLVISPWDSKLLKDIQKAIQVSDLGINPQNDGRVIRRDGMDYIKKLKKNSEITEDDQKKAEKDLQDLLDKNIKKVDAALAAKEKELMAI